MFHDLNAELPWRQRSDVKNGEEYLQPRLTAWFGEHPYSYSGVTHESRTEVCYSIGFPSFVPPLHPPSLLFILCYPEMSIARKSDRGKFFHTRVKIVQRSLSGQNEVLSTALAKHHANGDTSMVTEIVNLCPIM